MMSAGTPQRQRKIPSIAELKKRLRESSLRTSADRASVSSVAAASDAPPGVSGPSPQVADRIIKALGSAVERLSLTVMHQSSPSKLAPVPAPISEDPRAPVMRERRFVSGDWDGVPLRASVSTQGAMDWTAQPHWGRATQGQSPSRVATHAGRPPFDSRGRPPPSWRAAHDDDYFAQTDQPPRHRPHGHPRDPQHDRSGGAGPPERPPARRELFDPSGASPGRWSPVRGPLGWSGVTATSAGSADAPSHGGRHLQGGVPPRGAYGAVASDVVEGRATPRGHTVHSVDAHDAMRQEPSGLASVPWSGRGAAEGDWAEDHSGSEDYYGGREVARRGERWGVTGGGVEEHLGDAEDLEGEASEGTSLGRGRGGAAARPGKPPLAGKRGTEVGAGRQGRVVRHARSASAGTLDAAAGDEGPSPGGYARRNQPQGAGPRDSIDGRPSPAEPSPSSPPRALALRGEVSAPALGHRSTALVEMSQEIYPGVTGSFDSLGMQGVLARGKLAPKELVKLPKRELVQIVVAQRIRVVGMGQALRALRAEKRQVVEELDLMHELGNRSVVTPTAQHVTRRPASAVTRARVRESELLAELKRLREENRALQKAKQGIEGRETLITELQGQRQALLDKSLTQEQEVRRLRQEMRGLEDQVQADRAEVQRLVHRNQGLVERMAQMADTLSRSTGEIETLRAQVAESEETVDYYKWHRATADEGRRAALAEVERLRERVRDLTAMVHDMERGGGRGRDARGGPGAFEGSDGRGHRGDGSAYGPPEERGARGGAPPSYLGDGVRPSAGPRHSGPGSPSRSAEAGRWASRIETGPVAARSQDGAVAEVSRALQEVSAAYTSLLTGQGPQWGDTGGRHDSHGGARVRDAGGRPDGDGGARVRGDKRPSMGGAGIGGARGAPVRGEHSAESSHVQPRHAARGRGYGRDETDTSGESMSFEDS